MVTPFRANRDISPFRRDTFPDIVGGRRAVSTRGLFCLLGRSRLARNDQIVRILSVAQALSQTRRGISLKTLAARHGWPWRTVYYDVKVLKRAGFQVENDKGRHRMAAGWSVPRLPGIEPDEVLALYAMRALAESWRATALGRPLDRLWMKLTATAHGQGSLMPVTREPWFSVRSPIGIDYRAHEKAIATFDRAARDRLAVKARYRALSTGTLTERVIEPGELYWDPGLESLYVIGWCRLRQDIRVFALQRFIAANLTDESFTPRAGARSKAALRGAFRVWRDENIQKVRIRFAAKVAPEIRERVWAPGQRIDERWVLGYGGAAEVLGPPALRQAVAANSRAAAVRYGHLPSSARAKRAPNLIPGGRRPPIREPPQEDLLPRDHNRRR